MIVRPRVSVFVPVLPVIVGALLAVACSSSPEQELLQKYFSASRMRDNGTLANIATVAFSPTEQGTIQNFSVVNPGTEQRRPLKLKELTAAEDAARKADEEFNKKKKEYQDSNLTVIERVLKAERDNSPVRGPDVAVQTAWTKWREEASQHSEDLSHARQALSAERSVVEPSVYDARNPVDVTKFDGELVEKDITIKANVKAPDGQSQEKELVVHLSRADLTNGPEGKSVPGRWIITGIK